MRKIICGVAMLGMVPGMALADSGTSTQPLWNPQTSLLLAASSTSATETPATEAPVYKRRLITANSVHKYLGLGSLLAATLTVMSPKSEDTNGPHYQFAHAAAYLGAGAVATGVAFHLTDLRLSSGLEDPDNQHALLGLLGTGGYFAAIDAAPGESHPTYGMAGYASMALAIKLTW